MNPKHADIQHLTFEQAVQELEDIVHHFETGQVDLAASIEHYTRAIELKSHCDRKLRDAKLKVEKITSEQDGRAVTESFGA